MLLKVCQHWRSKPPTNTEARWPSQTHFFDEYQGEISRATVHWVYLRVCVCVCFSMSECDSLLSYGLTADCMRCYSHYTPITSEDTQDATVRHVGKDQNLTARDLNVASPAALRASTAHGATFTLLTCGTIQQKFSFLQSLHNVFFERNLHWSFNDFLNAFLFLNNVPNNVIVQFYFDTRTF